MTSAYRGLRPVILLLTTFLLQACGDDGQSADTGGVSRDKYLDEVSEEEKRTLCGQTVERFGAGEHACGPDTIVVDMDQCLANALFWDAHCSVAMMEDCDLSLNGDVCSNTPECTAFGQCLEAEDS